MLFTSTSESWPGETWRRFVCAARCSFLGVSSLARFALLVLFTSLPAWRHNTVMHPGRVHKNKNLPPVCIHFLLFGIARSSATIMARGEDSHLDLGSHGRTHIPVSIAVPSSYKTSAPFRSGYGLLLDLRAWAWASVWVYGHERRKRLRQVCVRSRDDEKDCPAG